MTKRQVILLVVLALFIALGVLAGFITREKMGPGSFVNENSPLDKSKDDEPVLIRDFYSPDIPKGATLSTPKNEAPASTNEELDSKARFFDLVATRDGFSPQTITVNTGDNVQIDFTSKDGDYDLDIPYLGAYFSRVESGKTKRLPFDVNLSGTFVFQCRDFCPRSGKIQGVLIVLP